MGKGRVLIVGDDIDGARVLEAYLGREGFHTLHTVDERQALDLHACWRPDLVLLDIKLLDLSGNEIFRVIRQHVTTPVIIVTAVSHEPSCVNALLYGADDYVIKPYNPGEVVARVYAVLRRWRRGGLHQSKLLRYDKLTIDVAAALASVEVDGMHQPLDLTRTEFNLLALLMASPARVYTRAELLASCLPESDALERVVDAHLYNLRRKLNRVDIKDLVLTVRGLGYRFHKPG